MPNPLRAAGDVVLVLAELAALVALIAVQQRRRRFEPRLAVLIVALAALILLWTNV